jgi:hypothetical protein
MRVERQSQHRRGTRSRGRQHQAAGDRTGHEPQARCVLLHVPRAPRGVLRAQGEAQLRVVAAGELVELAGARHFLQHVREIRRAIDRIGKRLNLHHELGIFDLVQGPRPVGQLHAGLERAITLAGLRHFPLLRRLVQALDPEGLAACAARRWKRGKRRFAGDRAFQRDRREHVDQGVERRLFLGGRHWPRHRRVEIGIDAGNRRGRVAARLDAGHGIRLARRVLARRPGVPGDECGQHEAAEDRKPRRETAQAASAIETAASMSTATMRDTPCSCIVTPISCSAISIAILLWLMKRNCVSRLMLVTSLA